MFQVARCVLDKEIDEPGLPEHKVAAEKQSKATSRIPWADQTLGKLFAMSRNEHEAQTPPNGTFSIRPGPTPSYAARATQDPRRLQCIQCRCCRDHQKPPGFPLS